MKYDGINFRYSPKCFILPHEYNERGHYVSFGRACKKDTPGAIRLNRRWSRMSPFGDPPEDVNGVMDYPIYVKQVESDGHSLTNMMYGKDGYTYLGYNGEVYVASWKKRRKVGQ